MDKITDKMSVSDLRTSISNNNSSLVEQWKCSEFSFRDLPNNADSKELLKNLRRNLRSNDFFNGMSGKEMADRANEGYAKKDVRRFQDFSIVDLVVPTLSEDPALNVVQTQEPSAIVTDDGERLDLLGGKFYTYTEDGYNFARPCVVEFENNAGYTGITCWNYFKANGKYYCTTDANLNNAPAGFVLWEEKTGTTWGETTTKKVFTNPKIIFPYDGGDLNNLGNSCIIKVGNTWYAFLEIAGTTTPYQIYVATSSTLDGIYTLVQSSPIIRNPERLSEFASNSVGNPEILMQRNGVPYMCDGKYYMMCHYMLHYDNKSRSFLYRYYSYDLINWVEEGPMLTGRANPELPRLTNADACWCEFKGRSYLFYMRNANQYLDPSATEPASINMLIDNRPMSVLLRLKP